MLIYANLFTYLDYFVHNYTGLFWYVPIYTHLILQGYIDPY